MSIWTREGTFGYLPDSAVAGPSSTLLADFECDACVEVSNGRMFYRAVFEGLGADLVSRMDVVECVYDERWRHYLNPTTIPAAALKDPVHAHQREVRGIFTPRRQPIGIIQRTIPEVRQYCRLLETIPDDDAH